MKQFFPLGKGEALLLVYLIVMAVISFLPMWRTMEIGGMAVFGWFMAALMFTSPLLALLLFRRADRSKTGKTPKDKSGMEDKENESRSFGSGTDSEA
jgi:uncharacterized membrane protein (DUF485 family)